MAPAPYDMPIAVVSVIVRERAPALREDAFFNCVLVRTERDTAGIVRQRERIKEFSKEAEGRPRGAVERWKRDVDAQMNK